MGMTTTHFDTPTPPQDHKTRYKMLRTFDHYKHEEQVQEYLDNGWQLHGPVQIVELDKGHAPGQRMEQKFALYQALTKEV